MPEQRQKQAIKQVQRINQEQIQSLKLLSLSYSDLIDQIKKVSEDVPEFRIHYQSTDEQDNKNLDWVPNQATDGLSRKSIKNEITLESHNRHFLQVIYFLIDNLDDHGYLPNYQNLITKVSYSPAQMNSALHVIQNHGPAGLGARNVAECFLLQIKKRSDLPPHTKFIIDNYLPLLAERHFTRLSQVSKVPVADLQKILAFIQTLKPGIPLASQRPSQTITPEVFIKIINGLPQATLIESSQLSFSFKADLKHVTNQQIKKFVNQEKQEVNTLIDGYQRRQSTILAIGQEIAKYQKEFFINRGKSIKPLKMITVAHDLEINVSTVSRAIKDKYLQCDFGIFPFRTFFSSAVNPNISQADILAHLQQIIKEENKNNPYSDEQIRSLLNRKYKIDISRRTVVKYRQKLDIPGKYKRRQ